MKTIFRLYLLAILIIAAGFLYAKSVQKNRRLWNAEVPAAAIDIESDGDLSINNDLNIDGDVDIDGNNLDLGDANIDYDSTNYEVDIDTSVKISAKYFIKLDTTAVVSQTDTPPAKGIFAIDSSMNVYISTNTNAGGWKKIGSQ